MAEANISFPKLRKWQHELFESTKKFNVVVVHRRRGKTVGTIIYLIIKALQEKGHYGYIAPTYKQSKNIAWDMLLKFTKELPGIKGYVSELKVVFPNGSKIQLFGADNPDSLRGLDLKGVIYDEYAQQPSNIHGEIIMPMLVANNGWATWIGTPKGSVNHFYELYKKAKRSDNFFVLYKTYKDTGLLSEEQIEMAKGEMTEDEFEQEYNLSWTANLRGAYYSGELEKMYKDGRSKKGIYEPLLPVYTFWDLGISDYTSIIFVQIFNQEIRIIDEHSENGKSLQHYAKVLKDKPYVYERHYFPHDIQVRELGSGMSRLEVVRQLFGSNKCFITKKMGVADGINATRIAFINLWFDEDKTKDLRAALSSYIQEFDEKNGVYKDKPKHDWSSHYADAFRYLGVMSKWLVTPTSGGLVIQDGGFDTF